MSLDLGAKLDLAKLFQWKREDVDSIFRHEGFKESPYFHWRDHDAEFSDRPYSNVSVTLTLHGKPLKEAVIRVDGDSGLVNRVSLEVTGAEPLEKLQAMANAVSPTTSPAPLPPFGWKSELTLRSALHVGSNATALLRTGNDGGKLILVPAGQTPTDAPGPPSAQTEGKTHYSFFVRVDETLPIPSLWDMTQDDVEKITLPGFQGSPLFTWTTKNRDSARFSSRPFGNISTRLLAFGDAVELEEALLDFKEGKPTRLVLTLMTRGSSRQLLDATAFDTAFKSTGRALGAMLGARPVKAPATDRTISKRDGYMWGSAHTVAMMEYNPDAPKGSVEFFRVTLSPSAERQRLLNLAGLGGKSTVRSGRSLLTSIKRDAATGTVEIVGIPMRDQGDKGYCVVASAERVLLYMGQPCDMDELAKLCGADARTGTDPGEMYKALRKVDARYYMRLRLEKLEPTLDLGLDEKTLAASELKTATAADLWKVAQANIDIGVPLLWCVLLPLGESGVPNSTTPQNLTRMGRVGHMRLITGYCANNQELIYSDSWGEGHERKVMRLAKAKEMTRAVFSMKPVR